MLEARIEDLSSRSPLNEPHSAAEDGD